MQEARVPRLDMQVDVEFILGAQVRGHRKEEMRRSWAGRLVSEVGGAVDQAVLSALSYRFQSRRPGARTVKAPDRDRRSRSPTRSITSAPTCRR